MSKALTALFIGCVAIIWFMMGWFSHLWIENTITKGVSHAVNSN